MAYRPRLAPAMHDLGTESAFQVLSRAQTLAAEGRDIINLGIGQPDFPTPAHIVEAGRRALAEGAHGYTPAAGLPALREAVADDLTRRHGLAEPVDPACVIVLPGGKPTMFFACLMLGHGDAEILFPDPGFPIYGSVARYSGARAVPYGVTEATGFSFDPDEILSKITPATSLVILNSPGNPTGGVAPRDAVGRLVAGLAAQPQVAILSDEIYSQMLWDGAEHASLLQYPDIRDRLILLDGWSKTYAMTGWRLGFAVWPHALVDHAERLCINDHSCVNAAAQHAGLAALTGPKEAVADMLDAFAARRRLITDCLNALPGISAAESGGAFYSFPNITGTGLTSRQMQDRLLEEAGIATVAGTSFGANGEGFLRLSYANSARNIERALDRMGRWLNAL